MACIEKFLGRYVEIPEDRRYSGKQGLWAKAEGEEIIFGLSQPSLMLLGGFNSMDWLVPDGRKVEPGESVIFAITGKISYIESPIGGIIRFNDLAKEKPEIVLEEPYGRGWLLKIKPEFDPGDILTNLSDAFQYLEILKTSEGFKNPDGLRGGMSSICKAVYTGIREQRL